MSSPGIELSESIASVIEQLAPSVVRVEARNRVPSTGIVWSGDGVIVTASHTVERDEGIDVGLPDGGTVTATLAGRDPTIDVAVLKVDTKGLTPAPFIDTTGLKVGHVVVALGRPGKTVRATMGIVSTLGTSDRFRTPYGGRLDRYVEPDLALRPGFNGGPLVDLSGGAIGLASEAVVRRATIAVPTATLRRSVEKLLAHGSAQRAYLGVGTYPVKLPAKLAEAIGQESALLVVSVEPDGPSEKAGLLLGDVLVSLDGKALSDVGELMEALSDDRIGRSVIARIWRAGQPLEVALTPGARGL